MRPSALARERRRLHPGRRRSVDGRQCKWVAPPARTVPRPQPLEPNRMRPRVILAIALAAIVLGGVLVTSNGFAVLRSEERSSQANTRGSGNVHAPGPSTNEAPPPPPPPPAATLAAGPVSVKVNGFYSWA